MEGWQTKRIVTAFNSGRTLGIAAIVPFHGRDD